MPPSVRLSACAAIVPVRCAVSALCRSNCATRVSRALLYCTTSWLPISCPLTLSASNVPLATPRDLQLPDNESGSATSTRRRHRMRDERPKSAERIDDDVEMQRIGRAPAAARRRRATIVP